MGSVGNVIKLVEFGMLWEWLKPLPQFYKIVNTWSAIASAIAF